MNSYCFSIQTVNASTTERAASPIPEKLKESQRNLEETTELYKSLRTAASISSDTKRMDRVNDRLKSVTVSTIPLF